MYARTTPDERRQLNRAIIDRTPATYKAIYEHFALKAKGINYFSFYHYARKLRAKAELALTSELITPDPRQIPVTMQRLAGAECIDALLYPEEPGSARKLAKYSRLYLHLRDQDLAADRHAATREVAQIRRESQRECAELQSESRRDCTAIRASTQRDCTTMRTSAQRDCTAMRTDTQRNLAEIRARSQSQAAASSAASANHVPPAAPSLKSEISDADSPPSASPGPPACVAPNLPSAAGGPDFDFLTFRRLDDSPAPSFPALPTRLAATG